MPTAHCESIYENPLLSLPVAGLLRYRVLRHPDLPKGPCPAAAYFFCNPDFRSRPGEDELPGTKDQFPAFPNVPLATKATCVLALAFAEATCPPAAAMSVNKTSRRPRAAGASGWLVRCVGVPLGYARRCFCPVEAAAAICHGGLLTGHSAAVLSATTRCFREITRSISVLQPAFSAHFSCSLLGDVIVPTTAWPPLYT